MDMNVCVIRNAEVESNAGMIRIIDALTEKNNNLLIISRTRFNHKAKYFYKKKNFSFKSLNLTNYEIQLSSEMGKGLRNIFQLLIYEIYLSILLIKNSKRYEVIHAFDLDAGLASLFWCFILRKKLVYHIADFYIDSRPGIPDFLKSKIRKLEYHIISKSNAVVICSEKRKKQIRGSKPKKLYIVHNVPISNQVYDDKSISIPKSSIGQKQLIIGYVGGLSRIHFTKEILETISNNSDTFLNIAGYGEYSNLVKEFDNGTNNIKYYGRIKYNSALYLYDNCDLMLMMYDPSVPIHRYSAPNKLYEAMMLGKAIIVTKGTGIDDIVVNENMGLAIEYNKNEFENAIKFLLDNPSELTKMKENAKNAYSKYSWEEMKARIQEIYNAI